MPNNSDQLSSNTPRGRQIYGSDGDDNILARGGRNHIFGGDGNDTLRGGPGADLVEGGNGDDMLLGSQGNDTLVGGTGNDTYFIGLHDIRDVIVELPNEGYDMVFSDISYTLPENVEQLRLMSSAVGTGNELDNNLGGSDGDDILEGLGGNDYIFGGSGSDVLFGGEGSDILRGGTGTDQLFGGSGNDFFEFRDQDVTNLRTASNTIEDFSSAEGDKISLLWIDTDSEAAGHQSFDFIGQTAFSGAAGELRYCHDGAMTWVEGDVNGDGLTDFTIALRGEVSLAVTDFLL